MSSILDALKKLEEEKTRKEQEVEAPPEEFHPEKASDDLITGPLDGRQVSFSLTPLTMMMIGGFAILVIVVSVSVSILLLKPAVAPVPPVASNPVQTDAAPASQPPETTTPAQQQTPAPVENAAAPETAQPETPQPQPAPAAPQPDPVPAPQPQPQPEAIQAAAAPDPEPAPLPQPQPVQVTTSAPQPAPVTAAAPDPEPEWVAPEPAVFTPPPAQAPEPEAERAAPDPMRPDPPLSTEEMGMLPLLRSSERMRHGLENLKMNVLREAGKNRANGLAIINLNKVYIGERIPDTRAILIGVEYRGIAIEIVDTGERYYVPK